MRTTLLISLTALLISPVHTFAKQVENDLSNEYRPEKIFGKNATKFPCIQENQKIKCHLPTIQEIDHIIKSYVDDNNNRLEMLQAFKNQSNIHMRKIMDIAESTEREIGTNEFSNLYRTYAGKLEKMLLHDYFDEKVDYVGSFNHATELLGLQSEYMARLQDIKNAIIEGSEQKFEKYTYERDYGDHVLKRFQIAMDTIANSDISQWSEPYYFEDVLNKKGCPRKEDLKKLVMSLA